MNIKTALVLVHIWYAFQSLSHINNIHVWNKNESNVQFVFEYVKMVISRNQLKTVLFMNVFFLIQCCLTSNEHCCLSYIQNNNKILLKMKIFHIT